MARDPVADTSSLPNALRTFRRPWPIMLAGLAGVIVGLMLSRSPWVPLRLLFLGGGVLLAGIAVARRLQTASWELEDRVESAGLLALSAFVALLAYFAMEPSWDSGTIFLGALIAIALVASFVVLLPRTGRRVAALVLVLLHFGGILTSVTAVPPRNEPAPWLSMQAWMHFYRPYLWFAYLTNAYHFYSPDPGPPTLLWFHVEYEDGSARWIKIPNKHESPVSLHHFRMLAAAENANSPIVGLPLSGQSQGKDPSTGEELTPIKMWEAKFKRKYELLPGIRHDSWEDIWNRRLMHGTSRQFTDPDDLDPVTHEPRPAPLPLVADMVPAGVEQYSEPQEMARRLLASYARHVARTSPDPNNPDNAVKAVRIYRVVHELISPRELNEGKEPWDPTTFRPFYMGKYDTDGRLLDSKDPFLFWLVPIIRVSQRYPEPGTALTKTPLQPGEPVKIINFVEIHATQSDKFQKSQ